MSEDQSRSPAEAGSRNAAPINRGSAGGRREDALQSRLLLRETAPIAGLGNGTANRALSRRERRHSGVRDGRGASSLVDAWCRRRVKAKQATLDVRRAAPAGADSVFIEYTGPAHPMDRLRDMTRRALLKPLLSSPHLRSEYEPNGLRARGKSQSSSDRSLRVFETLPYHRNGQ